MSQPKTISHLRKQILASYIPSIDTLGVIEFPGKLVSEEVIRFFKNANYVTGKLVPKKTEPRRERVLLVFNVERSFLIKYCKSVNQDGFGFFNFNRDSQCLAIESVQFEEFRIKARGGIQTISKSIFNFSSAQNSIIREFYKLKRNPKYRILPSKYKNMIYVGKRISFSKEEIGIMEDFDEMTTKYRMEIRERQNLQSGESNLSESFKWKNRGIINNMLSKLLQIECEYHRNKNFAT